MVALEMQQSIHITQSVSFRVARGIKPVVRVYEHVKTMDSGAEKSFLVNVSTKAFKNSEAFLLSTRGGAGLSVLFSFPLNTRSSFFI